MAKKKETWMFVRDEIIQMFKKVKTEEQLWILIQSVSKAHLMTALTSLMDEMKIKRK